MKLANIFPFTQQYERARPAIIDQGQSNSSSAYLPYYLSNGSLVATSNVTDPTVTEQGLLGLTAAWAAVNMIAHPVAVMLKGIDVFDPLGQIAPTPSIISDPCQLYSSPYEFYHELVSTVLIYGNYVAIIYEGELIPVSPTRVECRLSPGGYPVYKIENEYYSHEDILHIRGFTMPSRYWGIGVIEAQRRGLGAAVNMQAQAANTFHTAAIPSVAISLDQSNVPADALTQIAEDWQTAFGNGQRKPVVLPKGMTVAPISWNPNDAQFLESRQFSVAEIALMFGLSPTDLSATIGGQSLTYSNISQANMERIQRSYARWIMRVEGALQRKFLAPGYSAVANPESLLRMDTKSRYESYAIATGGQSWLTVDEVRELEHYEPLAQKETDDSQ